MRVSTGDGFGGFNWFLIGVLLCENFEHDLPRNPHAEAKAEFYAVMPRWALASSSGQSLVSWPEW
jgi:hypothetical protein